MAGDDKVTRRRQIDRLRGFAYFENFDEISKWNADAVDPLQRSNTPLLPRPTTTYSLEEGKSNVMLIHDYAGGYKEYESCQGATSVDEFYSCEYLQYVELFVYFTHKLVSIPPPTWVNCCHRNGVKVLGTFLVEPGSKMVESILKQDNDHYWLAEKLADMAKYFGFDGWLINIETSFPLLSWSADRLVGFLEHLRKALGDSGRVVWYDGLTVLNIVWYQNALNALNLRFAQATGSILINYAWNPELAQSSKSTAQLNGLPLQNVYIGIDVWAQNKQHGRNKRITYPVKGGGGTGIGLGMKELASLGLGTGIFAPAWSYEHFPKQGRWVERAIWTGKEPPTALKCDCGDETMHSSVPYETNPVTKYARRCAAGSETFFHSDYTRAFSRKARNSVFKAHLGQLSVMPISTVAVFSAINPQRAAESQTQTKNFLVAELRDDPPRCCITFSKGDERQGIGEISARLTLHEFTFSPKTKFELFVTYSKRETAGAVIDIFVQGDQQWFSTRLSDEAVNCGTIRTELTIKTGRQPLSCGVKVRIQPGTDASQPGISDLVDISNLTVAPSTNDHGNPTIGDARVVKSGHGELTHNRLVWSISGIYKNGSAEDDGLPWSDITGPFSYFNIAKEGKVLGRAYGLECVLDKAAIDSPERPCDETEFVITGYGFDGRVLADKKVVVSDLTNVALDNDWVVV